MSETGSPLRTRSQRQTAPPGCATAPKPRAARTLKEALIAAFPAVEIQIEQLETPVAAAAPKTKSPNEALFQAILPRNPVLFQAQIAEQVEQNDRTSLLNKVQRPGPTANELAPEDRFYGPCGIALLFPTFVTDGQKVVVRNKELAGNRVRLNGFRYDLVPSRSTPGGENRQLIFSDCVLLDSETVSAPDGVLSQQRFFRIPMDAPTGEYDIFIDSGCPTEAPEDCERWARLYVTQSHMVTTVPRLGIVGNSETDRDKPERAPLPVREPVRRRGSAECGRPLPNAAERHVSRRRRRLDTHDAPRRLLDSDESADRRRRRVDHGAR